MLLFCTNTGFYQHQIKPLLENKSEKIYIFDFNQYRAHGYYVYNWNFYLN